MSKPQSAIVAQQNPLYSSENVASKAQGLALHGAYATIQTEGVLMSMTIDRRAFLGLTKGVAAIAAPYLAFTLTGCSSSSETVASPSNSDASAQEDSTKEQTDTVEEQQQEEETPQVPGVEQKANLEDYSWDEIAQIAAAISAAESDERGFKIAKGYNVTEPYNLSGGGTKTLTFADGSTVTAWVAGFRHDDKADGTGKAGITFITSATKFESDFDTSTGRPWVKSDVRDYLANTVLSEKFPQDLASKVVTVNKATVSKFGSTDPSVCTATADAVWLPSAVEIVGTYPSFLSSKDEAYDALMKAEGNQYTLFFNPSDESLEGRDDSSKIFVDEDTGIARHEVAYRVMSRDNNFLNSLVGTSDGFWTRSVYPTDGGGAISFCKPDGENEKDFNCIYPWAKLNLLLGFCL